MKTNQPAVMTRIVILLVAVLFALSVAWLSYGNYRAGAELWQLGVNALLLAVPLGLLYFSIGLLALAARQKRSQGEIGGRLAKLIVRTPRVAGVLITLFVGLFALDAFSEGQAFWEMVAGFLVHALPAILLAILLALAWRRPWIGFAAFLAAAVLFLRFVGRDPINSIQIVLLFSGPMAAIALLFWASWKWQKALHPPKQL